MKRWFIVCSQENSLIAQSDPEFNKRANNFVITLQKIKLKMPVATNNR